MRIRSELLIVILIVLIIPLLVIASYSTETITANAKEEMSLRANSLAEKCNSMFIGIKEQSYILAERARDIENNPEKYKNLYKEDEYYKESRGAFVATQPEDPKDKCAIWVPNTLPITKEMKKAIGLTKNLEILYRATRASNPNVEWVASYYENGLMLCYPYIDMEKARPSGSHDPREIPQVLKAKESPRNIGWWEPYWDIGGHGWLITCWAKVYDKNNEFVCFQSLDVSLKTIEKEITRTRLYDTGYAFLIDERGNLLAFPEENEKAKKDLLVTLEGKIPSHKEIEEMKITLNISLLDHPNKEFAKLIEKTLEDEALPIELIEKVKFEKEKYLVLVPIESTSWAVGVVVPIGEVLVPVRNAIIIALIVAVLVALGASLFTGKRIAQPLIKLSETSDKIAKGDLTARADTKSTVKEFYSVSNDINRMVDSLQIHIEELRQAIGFYSKVLNEVALGKLTARVDIEELKGEYKLLGEVLNSIISILEYDAEELGRKDVELNQTLSVCANTLDKIVQKGDLSARIDINKLAGKYKQMGSDINLIVDSLQSNIEELRQALSSCSEVLGRVAAGELTARVDTEKLKEEYKLLGDTLNSVISILEYNTKELKKK
jgi:HAMP domain-containing protein